MSARNDLPPSPPPIPPPSPPPPTSVPPSSSEVSDDQADLVEPTTQFTVTEFGEPEPLAELEATERWQDRLRCDSPSAIVRRKPVGDVSIQCIERRRVFR